MTRKEIDILVEAARKSCAVVEKASNMIWSQAELLEARAAGQYQDPDQLLPPDGHMDVSAPYPGCLQMGGTLSVADPYRAVAQTEHFVIFAALAAH
jgi:hypothetical protein